MYEEDNTLVDTLNTELLQTTKERDKFKAWKDGLDAVLKATDPAARCAPAPPPTK
jgi:hypothetical protein